MRWAPVLMEASYEDDCIPSAPPFGLNGNCMLETSTSPKQLKPQAWKDRVCVF